MALSTLQALSPGVHGLGLSPAWGVGPRRGFGEVCLPVAGPAFAARDTGIGTLDVNAGGLAAGQAGCDSVKIAIKFLLSNVAAGVVIGKAGSNITELQEISGARIQLSRNNVFYPGTVERVLLLTGTVKNVLVALYLILVKLTGRAAGAIGAGGGGAARSKIPSPTCRSEVQLGSGSPLSRGSGYSPTFSADGMGSSTKEDGLDSPTQLKIVMPAAVCGAIIGRGGETIRSFGEDSGASISVSPQERGGARAGDPRTPSPAPDRIVTVTGGVNQILRAVALVVTTVAEDPNYFSNVGLSVNYAAPRGAPPSLSGFPHAAEVPSGGHFPFGACLAAGGLGSVTPRERSSQFNSGIGGVGAPASGRLDFKLSVPDEHVGAIIGKGGEILAQLQALVGVKVTISGRGDFEPGTRNRTVSISGPSEAVQIAHLLVSQKINERLSQLYR